mgnify:CR=1 FL=1
MLHLRYGVYDYLDSKYNDKETLIKDLNRLIGNVDLDGNDLENWKRVFGQLMLYDDVIRERSIEL